MSRGSERDAAFAEPAEPQAEGLDTRFLESLVGYNARRAALYAIAVDMEVFSAHRLRVVDFSVLSVLRHNPGATSRQLCQALGILPPNLVALLNALVKRALVERRPHPSDGRAMALHLTPAGARLTRDIETTVASLEKRAAGGLTAAELRTLNRLLQKIYLGA